MNQTCIATTNLTKIYGKTAAVDGINLHVPRGRIFGFLGPNGAGKSTTISMLSTILPPTSGSATILGHDVVKERGKVRDVIGVCPQDLVIYELLSARENLHLIARMHDLHPSDFKERADELLGRMNLLDRAGDKVKTFSGGMKRRVNVLMSVIHDPEVIFLDEPSAGLDPQSRRVVWDFIKDFERDHKTVVLTTHNMEEADDLSDRLAIIDHGRIIAEGPPRELKRQAGTTDVIEFKVPGHQIAARQAIVDLLAAHEGTETVTSLGKEMISIKARNGLQDLASFDARVFDRFSFHMEELHIRQNSLEDVFLALTGRQLRD